MIHFLVFLASIACAQVPHGTNDIQEDRISTLETALGAIQNGRPVLSSYISERGSITFLVAGTGIVWADGTISTSAGAGGAAFNYVRRVGDTMTGALSVLGAAGITASYGITAGSITAPDAGAEVLNVKSTGVKGDGATDDTAAIQAIFNSMGSKNVMFPCGQYITSSPLTINNASSFHIYMPKCAYMSPNFSNNFSLIMSTVTDSYVEWNLAASAASGVKYTYTYNKNELLPHMTRNTGKSANKPAPLSGTGSIGVKYEAPPSAALPGFYNRLLRAELTNFDVGVWYSSGSSNNANSNEIWGVMCDNYWWCVVADAEEEQGFGITGADNNGSGGVPTTLLYLSSNSSHSIYTLYGEGDSLAQMLSMDVLAGANGANTGSIIFEGDNFITPDTVTNSSNTIIRASAGIVSGNGGPISINGNNVGIGGVGSAGPLSALDVNGNVALHAVNQKYCYGTGPTDCNNSLYRNSVTGSDVFNSPIGWEWGLNGINVATMTSVGALTIGGGLTVASGQSIGISGAGAKYTFGATTDINNYLGRDSVTGNSVLSTPIGIQFLLSGSTDIGNIGQDGSAHWGFNGTKSTFSATGALSIAPTQNIGISGSGARYTFGASSDVNNFLGRDATTGNTVLGSPVGWTFQENVGGVIVATMDSTGNLAINGAFTGVGTGITGTAANLTAGHVTTNANLTGDVTSSGNATTAAATQGNIKVLSGLTTISNPWTSNSSGTINANFGVQGTTFTVSNGYYSSPSQPCGRFYRLNNQNIPNGVATPVFFDTSEFTQGGVILVAASSGSITIPVTGVYQISGSIEYGAAGATYYIAWIQRNSTEYATNRAPSVVIGPTLPVADTISLTAGDTISLYGQQNLASPQTIGGGGSDRDTFLALCKIN